MTDEHKLNTPTFPVAYFGAVGDGVADDTAALLGSKKLADYPRDGITWYRAQDAGVFALHAVHYRHGAGGRADLAAAALVVGGPNELRKAQR